MKYLLTFIVFIFSISAWSQNISFKKSIVVGGQPNISVKLIDVIEPDPNIGEVTDLLAGVEFAKIKKLDSVELSRLDLIKKLKSIKKNNKSLSKINFVIPSEFKITHLGYNLNTRVVVESLKRSWAKKCSNCKFIIDSVVLPELSSEYKNEPWFVQSSSNLPKGRFSAQIIYPNVPNPASVWVTGQSYTTKPVLVVGSNVSKGDFIASAPLKFEFRRLDEVVGAITSIDNFNHKVTNKYLMNGDVIKSSNLSDKVIFKRGAAVKLVYLDGGLKIVTSAIADSLGKVGHSVWVKNLKSNKRISGVVSETGEVIVQ